MREIHTLNMLSNVITGIKEETEQSGTNTTIHIDDAKQSTLQSHIQMS